MSFEGKKTFKWLKKEEGDSIISTDSGSILNLGLFSKILFIKREKKDKNQPNVFSEE